MSVWMDRWFWKYIEETVVQHHTQHIYYKFIMANSKLCVFTSIKIHTTTNENLHHQLPLHPTKHRCALSFWNDSNIPGNWGRQTLLLYSKGKKAGKGEEMDQTAPSLCNTPCTHMNPTADLSSYFTSGTWWRTKYKHSALPGSFILPKVCLLLCFFVLKQVSQKSKSSQFLHLNLDPLIGTVWQPSHLFLRKIRKWRSHSKITLEENSSSPNWSSNHETRNSRDPWMNTGHQLHFR